MDGSKYDGNFVDGGKFDGKFMDGGKFVDDGKFDGKLVDDGQLDGKFLDGGKFVDDGKFDGKLAMGLTIGLFEVLSPGIAGEETIALLDSPLTRGQRHKPCGNLRAQKGFGWFLVASMVPMASAWTTTSGFVGRFGVMARESLRCIHGACIGGA